VTFLKIPFELIIWVAALLLLFFLPIAESSFTICPLYHLGVDFCPGCGLGRSVQLLLHGQIAASFKMHPLGIITVPLLLFRIIQLCKLHFKTNQTIKYE